MKNKFKIIFSVLVLFSVSSFSQNLDDNWKLIKSNDTLQIFVDSSRIASYGTDVSVWAVKKLKTPKTISDVGKVSAIKTHYLFDKVKRRYIEIGVIYYDKRGGIINRSSGSAGFTSGPSSFKSPVSSDENVKTVLNEVISYLITGKFTFGKDNGNQSQAQTEKATIPEEVAPPPITVNTEKELPKQELSSEEEVTEDTTENSRTNNLDEEIEKIVPPDLHEEVKPVEEYDISKERALKNAIFTDGNLYCVQVSSWKTRAYADRELNKLLSHGYNAFIVSVKPKHKRSIWHRVRVGYFSTLQEAKKIQKELKRIMK